VIILLDAGPLGLISHPQPKGSAKRAHEWAIARIEAGDELRIPEITDYEVRRELVRAEQAAGLARLDTLCDALGYEPLTTAAMRDAAALWAQARNVGLPTAVDAALDGDVILAAQARALSAEQGDDVVVATTNPKHLKRFVDARVWSAIRTHGGG
jgi:hypothetical protein